MTFLAESDYLYTFLLGLVEIVFFRTYHRLSYFLFCFSLVFFLGLVLLFRLVLLLCLVWFFGFVFCCVCLLNSCLILRFSLILSCFILNNSLSCIFSCCRLVVSTSLFLLLLCLLSLFESQLMFFLQSISNQEGTCRCSFILFFCTKSPSQYFIRPLSITFGKVLDLANIFFGKITQTSTFLYIVSGFILILFNRSKGIWKISQVLFTSRALLFPHHYFNFLFL